ncbi:hypothetical protein [Roseococcus sp.]
MTRYRLDDFPQSGNSIKLTRMPTLCGPSAVSVALPGARPCRHL